MHRSTLLRHGSSHDTHNVSSEEITRKALPEASFTELRLHERGSSTDEKSLLTGPESRKSSFRWLKGPSARKCSLPTVHKHGWKPETMKAPVLAAFAMASLLLASLLEVLAQQSQKAGGLSLVKNPNDLPSWVTFSYLYIPTIIAVIFSLAWSWIDLDVKRMQPWLELSKEDGAAAEYSLFLDYPFDFVAFVPFKAAKRRHWTVFLAGTIMVLIFWLITPLQSAVIGVGLIDMEAASNFSLPSQLISPSDQAAALDQSVLNTAFALTWLNQSYPAYTTKDYALLPSKAANDSQRGSSAGNWTIPTTKLSTDLHCWPATIKEDLPTGLGTYNFDNGRGCNISSVDTINSIKGDRPYRILYIGYHNSAWADYSLQGPHCSNDSSHQFLAIWSRFISADEEDVVAAFCETSYTKQNVSITVSASDFSPIEDTSKALGPKEPLDQTEFNSTAFEYLLGSGVSAVDMQRDWPSNHLVEQFPRFSDQGMLWPVSPMVGFAVGAQSQPVSRLNNVTLLEQAFRSSHKTLFSAAINHLDSDRTDFYKGLSGTVHFQMYGVKISRSFSIAVESLLLAVALLTLAMLRICQTSQSKLHNDPSSVGSLIDVIRLSPDLLDDFSGKGSFTDERLREVFQARRFRIRCGCESVSGNLLIETIEGSPKRTKSFASSYSTSITDSHGHYSPVQPIALRKGVGLVFLVAIMAAIATLSYFKAEERRLGGLIRPFDNFEALQLLENFIPTALATLIEPFWVLLNRFLCILQPFKDMWSGGKRPAGSIDAKYTAMPPQLAVFSAIRSRHFILAAVCSISLLSNVLAVGLGGLFNEFPVNVSYSASFQPLLAPRTANDSLETLQDHLTGGFAFSYEDHFYVTLANLTSGTRLPPWTNEKLFFQPAFILDGSADNRTEIFNVSTRGFGVKPSCVAVESSTQPPSLDLKAFKRERGLDGTPNCTNTYQSERMLLDSNQFPPHGPSAFETIGQLVDYTGLNPCQKILVTAWARTREATNPNGTVDSSFVVCYPEFQTAMFNVSVDSEGHILSSVRASDTSTDLGYSASGNHTDYLISLHNNMFQDPTSEWHNDTASRAWMSDFIKEKTKSRTTLDPNEPVPDTKTLIPLVEEMYERNFALLMSLNQDIFALGASEDPIAGTKLVPETRIFLSNEAFIISITILALNALTAVCYYGRGVKHFLPRLPTTIGSILAYIAASKTVREYAPQRNRSFAFGRYVGVDGRAQVGIEMSQLVVPVELASLRQGDTIPRDFFLRRLYFWRKSSETGDTWL